MTSHINFAPINQIHQCLHAYHVPSHDRQQTVEAFHYCACLNPDMHQCIIYDSDQPTARLIGIEYVISQELFQTLSMEERPYWHSHKHEIASGLLCVMTVTSPADHVAKTTSKLVPGVVEGLPDHLEKGPLSMLYTTYGKTIHTWHPLSQPLPIGPPILMTSTTAAHPGPRSDEALLAVRKETMGIDTEAKEEFRKTYLDPEYKVIEGADEWEKSGKARVIQIGETRFRREGDEVSKIVNGSSNGNGNGNGKGKPQAHEE